MALLAQALDDDEGVAQGAVKGLGLLGGDGALEALLGVVSRDSRNSVRAATARELGAWPPSDAVTGELLRLLTDDSREVRIAAFLSLDRMGAPDAIPHLRRVANTPGAIDSYRANYWLERNPGGGGPAA